MHPEVKPEYFDSVKILMSGAAPLGGDDEERFLSKIENRNVNVIQGIYYIVLKTLFANDF